MNSINHLVINIPSSTWFSKDALDTLSSKANREGDFAKNAGIVAGY